ncbi:hypothetical protein, partial [Larkinella sp. C7]|uniref:hypothetical protein n=1 Tax=Larkinella sp. C7 TaxID=2576607 RepID=UPI001E2D2D39
MAIQENLTRAKFVKTHENIDNGGLARTSRTDKGDGLALLDAKADIIQNLPFAIIGKADIFEFDIALGNLEV